MKMFFFIGGMLLLLLVFAAGACSEDKKEGEECERDIQCAGLLVCYKEGTATRGKCMSASRAKQLYAKAKEEKER